jgi:hypothetical protein
MRQAQLQNALGRVLATSGNPLVRGFGQGLMAGGAVNASQAGAALDAQSEQRHLAGQQHQAEREAQYEGRNVDQGLTGLARADQAFMGRARMYADKPVTSTPAALHDLSPGAVQENRALLMGRVFDGQRAAGFGLNLEAVKPVVDSSYGAWVAQGQPGHVAAQLGLFDIVQNTANYQTPAAFVEAFEQHAGKHEWQLPAEFAQLAEAMFTSRHPAGG